MKPVIHTLSNWPMDKKLIPIFTCTQDALLYAQLVPHDTNRQHILAIARHDTYVKLSHERNAQHPNLQRMCDLAVKAQFYRECLQECHRIEDEKFTK